MCSCGLECLSYTCFCRLKTRDFDSIADSASRKFNIIPVCETLVVDLEDLWIKARQKL
jgi:hypothetical protein